MKGYDEQYNCLVRFNVVTDLNSAKAVSTRNRELRRVAELLSGNIERNVDLADEHQYAANMEYIKEFEREFGIDVEEDAKEYLCKVYKDARFGKLRKKLNLILDKEFEYTHLKDLAVCLMPAVYFKEEMYSRYADYGAAVRDNMLNMKGLIKYLNVNESSFRIILRLDYALQTYLQENMRLNVKEVESTLFSKAIEERDFKSISYVLSNLYSERYKGQYSADVKVTRSEVDEMLDGMTAEELGAMFNVLGAMSAADSDSEDSGE